MSCSYDEAQIRLEFQQTTCAALRDLSNSGFSIGYTLDAVGPIVVASMLSIFVPAGRTKANLESQTHRMHLCSCSSSIDM